MTNSTLGERLVLLWQMLQQPATTFGEVLALSSECGLDGRQVLANHFAAPAVIVGSLEA